MHVVIVESPSKAKTINKYLGDNYYVVASYGHVRDLPSKDGSVDPDNDFAMSWEIDRESNKRLTDLAKHVKNCDKLYLATDPDREGEAISWHVLDVLDKKKALKGVEVKRVVFNEITKSAILKAMAEPRDLDQELVDAYLARRALDYLVGFNLSPVLWRKLPGARSAGRVQSVTLRLICQREHEIETFVPQEFWSVDSDLRIPDGSALGARLVSLDGKTLKKFDLNSADKAKAAADIVRRGGLTVTSLEKKPGRRNPQPPFTTSTLQQEAARKLGFSAMNTMRVAQALYEGKSLNGETTGLITYMRTDGVTLAQESINAARSHIVSSYGKKYLPAKPNYYKTKAKNAQEAHEAIRPTDPTRRPSDVAHVLNPDELKLYELIWRRMISSQMEPAIQERTTITIHNPDKSAELRVTGSILTFDGFMKVYQEGRDDQEEEGDRLLPPVAIGTSLSIDSAKANQHFTEPAARYSEASLVKKLEELGIGRPSTYASILQVLQERDYVSLDKKRFIPDDRGRLVIAFLENFFNKYVEYDFTANLENELDQVAEGKEDWKAVLRRFWSDFKPKTEEVLGVRNSVIIDALNDYLKDLLFPSVVEGQDPRKCPLCDDGRLSLKTGRYGAFVGCSNYPECNHTRPFGTSKEGDASSGGDEDRILGTDPATGLDVNLKKGRFGPYVQIGEVEKGSKEKPKRASLPKGADPAELTLERALILLSLPREVGLHPESGKMITSAIGRFGPYLAHNGGFASLSNVEDVFSVGVNHAVAIIADAAAKKSGTKTILKELGDHPSDEGPVNVLDGKYGPYVNHKRINATLPKNTDPLTVTMEQALEWLAAKAKNGSAKKKAAPKKKAASKKKTAPKKKAAAMKKTS